MATTPYDSYNGPLWRVQLQYEPDRRCSEPDLESSFPYEYTLLIGTHHGITDGHSKHMKIALLLNLLNDVIDGKPITDDQYGFISDSSETTQLVKEREEEFRLNPDLFAKVKEEYEKLEQVQVLWDKVSGNFGSDQPRNLHITRVLDAETNSKLYNKFKSLGASFHAGFCSAVDVAIVEMLKKSGFDQPVYTISGFHSVNSRRFWKNPDKDFAFGNNYGTFAVPMDLQRDVKANMDDYIKEYHSKLLSYIKDKRTIDDIIFSSSKEDENGVPMTINDYMNDLPSPSFYYLSSNMRDVTSLLGKGGDHVQLTWLTRSTSIQNFNYPCLFMFHTYRGKLMVGFDYNTRYMSTAVAKEFLDLIFDILKDFVK